MPEREAVLRRFVARIRAIFEESWVSPAAVGDLFRRGISAVSSVNSEYLHLQDRAAEAPDLAWRAVQGLAGEKHAKAIADYARAENDEIDLALKRRIFEDKARQERAAADKLEAEAAVAKLNELMARAELARELRDLGVKVVVNGSGYIDVSVVDTAPLSDNRLQEIFTLPERRMLGMVVDVRAPLEGSSGYSRPGRFTLTMWLCATAQTVAKGQPLCYVADSNHDFQILSPADGTVSDIVANVGDEVILEKTVLCRISRK